MTYKFEKMNFERDWSWFTMRTKAALCDDTKGITVTKQNYPVAAVAFDSWTENCVTGHIAIDDAMVLRHNFIEEFMRYVFVDCNKKMMIAVVNSGNDKILNFIHKIGFHELYRLPDGYKDGIDIVVAMLERRNCEYLKEKDDGKEKRPAAAA